MTWPNDTGDVNAKDIGWDALTPWDWRPEILMGDVDSESACANAASLIDCHGMAVPFARSGS